MDWLAEHWDSIAPVVLAVLGLVAAWLERKGKKQALGVAEALIAAIEKIDRDDVKKAAHAESVLKGVAKPLASLVEKLTGGVK